jgi:hypothetical protein
MLTQNYQARPLLDSRKEKSVDSQVKLAPPSRYFQSPRNNTKPNTIGHIMNDVEQFKANKLQNIAVARPQKDFSPQLKPKADKSKLRRYVTSNEDASLMNSRLNSSVENGKVEYKKLFNSSTRPRRSKSEIRDSEFDDFRYADADQYMLDRTPHSPQGRGKHAVKPSKNRINLRPLPVHK